MVQKWLSVYVLMVVMVPAEILVIALPHDGGDLMEYLDEEWESPADPFEPIEAKRAYTKGLVKNPMPNVLSGPVHEISSLLESRGVVRAKGEHYWVFRHHDVLVAEVYEDVEGKRALLSAITEVIGGDPRSILHHTLKIYQDGELSSQVQFMSGSGEPVSYQEKGLKLTLAVSTGELEREVLSGQVQLQLGESALESSMLYGTDDDAVVAHYIGQGKETKIVIKTEYKALVLEATAKRNAKIREGALEALREQRGNKERRGEIGVEVSEE